jgi:hypothetical protein
MSITILTQKLIKIKPKNQNLSLSLSLKQTDLTHIILHAASSSDIDTSQTTTTTRITKEFQTSLLITKVYWNFNNSCRNLRNAWHLVSSGLVEHQMPSNHCRKKKILKPNFEFSATDDSRHVYNNNLYRKIQRKPNSNLFFLFFLSSILVHDKHPKNLPPKNSSATMASFLLHH